MALKSNRSKKDKRRLLMSLLAVILPGIFVCGFAVYSVSQQRRAREVNLDESHRVLLHHARSKLERRIETLVQKAFNAPITAQGTIAARLEQVKNLLLDNPIIRYPFISDASGGFLFPVSSTRVALKEGLIGDIENPSPGEGARVMQVAKGGGFYALYKKGREYEYKERRFGRAVVSYLSALKKEPGQSAPPYVLYAVVRCYYKMNRFPQALEYLDELSRRYPAVLNADKTFYFNILHRRARIFRGMSSVGKSVEAYLHLYDEILKYELSGAGTFTFFKNEALDYLNSHIDAADGVSEKYDRARAREGLGDLSRLDMDLRWKFYDVAPLPQKENARAGGAYTFGKIRELYLPNDEKTLFYNKIKELNPAASHGTVGGNRRFDAAAGINHIAGGAGRFYLVYKKIAVAEPEPAASAASAAGGGTPQPLYFGFMLSLDYVRGKLLPEVAGETAIGDGLAIEISQASKAGAPTGSSHSPRSFLLKRVAFDLFLSRHSLSLTAPRADYIQNVVKRELWFNYGMVLVVFVLFVIGTWLFYTFMTGREELVRLKSDFVDAASHTLKTPLTRIRMLAEKLELGWIKDEEAKKKHLQRIIDETDRMSEMISGMLDFSKVESGAKQYTMEQASIVRHVEEVIAQQRRHILDSGFRLEVDLQEDIPLFYFDPEALRLILLNVLQNALKYCRQEKVLSIKLFTTAACAVLQVEDSGIGFSFKEREKIFRRFYRVEDERVKASEGSGLGLFLVQHAVEAHGGKIEVNSDVGKGSCFRFYFPIHTGPFQPFFGAQVPPAALRGPRGGSLPTPRGGAWNPNGPSGSKWGPVMEIRDAENFDCRR
ncbi:MAG: hypothetical protein GY765_03250 [bacterium]|nr:hypothetical protein [bacterium]